MDNSRLLIGPKIKKPKGDDGYAVTSIRIKRETMESIEEILKQTDQSRNHLIGILLEFALDNYIAEK